MKALWAFLFAAGIHGTALAGEAMLDTFDDGPEKRWDYFADTVMGGVSSGQGSFAQENGKTYARLTGQVSTENRGGFIQIRRELPKGFAEGMTGVRLLVRGNNQKYFVHLRTSGTLLPWQYYQSGFDVKDRWTEVRIPFSAFKASSGMLRSQPRASSLKSIAIVAFGRDHQAEVEVMEVGFY